VCCGCISLLACEADQCVVGAPVLGVRGFISVLWMRQVYDATVAFIGVHWAADGRGQSRLAKRHEV
jgi:hypothetical protein